MFYFCFFLQPSAASFAASIKFSIKMCRTQVSQLAAPKSLTTIVTPTLSMHSLGMLSERSSDSLPSFFFFLENTQRQRITTISLAKRAAKRGQLC